MIIINPDLLREIAMLCRCDYCGKPVPTGCHPHHCFTRGMGGGGRLDVRVNLAAL